MRIYGRNSSFSLPAASFSADRALYSGMGKEASPRGVRVEDFALLLSFLRLIE
jgi:hypothetical protein